MTNGLREEMAARYKSALVAITTYRDDKPLIHGSGFLRIRADGYLLTNQQVIWEKRKISRPPGLWLNGMLIKSSRGGHTDCLQTGRVPLRSHGELMLPSEVPGYCPTTLCPHADTAGTAR